MISASVIIIQGIIMTFDLFAAVTQRIIDQLEQGTVPWHKPWVGGAGYAMSHVTGKPYSLLNHLLLGGRTGEYLTFKQCTDEGGKVKAGEKASMIVFWKILEDIDQETGEITKTPFLRYYKVFHIDQCEGISPHYDKAHDPGEALQPDAKADSIITEYIKRSGVKMIVERSGKACYTPATDTITIPLLRQFRDMPEFYSTGFHEMTHSTGHPSRLNRLTESAAFGGDSYSKEELVAELGSSFLMNYAGIETPSSFQNNAAYLAGWLKALKDDKRLIVSAAGKAEQAVKYILGEEDDDDET